MTMEKFVIGVDFGSDSCRGVITNTKDGKEMVSEVFAYPRWKEGLYCDASISQFRQHPLDYIEGLKHVIKESVKKVDPYVVENIVGISVDTTASTPCAVDREGTPLALLPEFKDNPNAMFILWKDHTAVQEAALINEKAKSWPGVDFTKYVGGIYSSEWFFAKILKVLRTDEKVREKAYSFVEHCDWIPALLTGNKNPEKIYRSRCVAGHKAMWNKEFDGLPSEEFLTSVDPLFKGLRDRLYKETYTSDVAAGVLTKEWASELGLPEGIKVGVGAIDCHMGAVGGNIKPKALIKVMGTSTCDIMVADNKQMENVLVKGICGQVDGSVIPGMLGMEAGQAAYGDIYAWYKRLLAWPLKLVPREYREQAEDKMLYELEKEAQLVDPRVSGILAIDWMNGRRTPDANLNLRGAIMGLNLGSDAPKIYRALIEATAYGSRAIIERFRKEGIEINEVIAIGGVALSIREICCVANSYFNPSDKPTTSISISSIGIE
jgi:L-ribulokinase